MFKTLLTTALLSFSVGSGTLKQLSPKEAHINGTYILKGSYCFNDEVQNYMPDDFYDIVEYQNYIIYDWQDYANYAYDIYASYYVANMGRTESTIVRTLEIYVHQDDSADPMNFDFHIYTGDYTIREYLTTGDLLEEMPVDCHNLIIYFPRALYVDSGTYNAFMSLFNGIGNQYVEQYNGYYTFTTNTNGERWFVYGDVLYENSLYNFTNYSFPLNESANCYVALNDYDDLYGDTLSANVITNGRLNGKNYVMFNNVLISTRVKSRMALTGVFAYVRPEQPVTFGEMIFSVIDAPVYMLSQLFSFELFGVQFYVAFMSIVTVVLICFVLKKII